MKKITFCIASAKNEKEYTTLLLNSLKKNTQIENHEILIFLDSDNQNSYEHFLEFQSTMPNLKIHRNTSEFPIGGQLNISIMFHNASNPIVCYLQSDMVAGKDLDKHIPLWFLFYESHKSILWKVFILWRRRRRERGSILLNFAIKVMIVEAVEEIYIN